MNMKYAVALSLTAGIAIGAVAIDRLHAQAKPPVYVVNEVEITDQAGFQKYAEDNSKLIQKHGGKYLVRGGKIIKTLTGPGPTGRYTIYSFENESKMNDWLADPAQKDVVATRDKVAKFRSFVVEGLPQ
jgi:uncharacterized protein (DUF1330 family)